MGSKAERKELSYSSFHTYEDCPQRWKFLYVDGLKEAERPYFSFGRSMHMALEAFVGPLTSPHRVRRQGQMSLFDFGAHPPSVHPMPLDDLLRCYRELWIRDGYGSEDEERKYFLIGTDLLRRFHSLYVAAPPQAIAVERDLSGKMGEIPIHGIIDRIDLREEGGLEVVDYKTSRELSLGDAESSDQLTFYQVLVGQNYDRPVHKLTLYHLRSMRPLSTQPRGGKAIGDLTSRVGTVLDGMRRQAFEPKPGSQCRRCEFRPLCPAFHPEKARKSETL
ncbi:MAG: PD-(D/E)XK nuclease family protein [Candidatus Thermoplasmatota archaeon]|jgi:CRISPR/Cas system-associated exonuclease Cas4 (RecB family)|nr:PD-(D/E)XK nuclease family protein [Candidatus Thermoplasmatota archaeon]